MPSSEGSLFGPLAGDLGLPDARLQLWPAFLDPAECGPLFAQLCAELPWQTQPIRMFGKWLMQPRLICWVGDPGTVYTYSHQVQHPQPWTPTLQTLRCRIEAITGARYNSVLINRYRNQHDSVSWHADNEAVLGPTPAIASLSLGATRRFQLRHPRRALRHTLHLADGSLLLMAGPTQRHWQHAVPKESRPTGERLNLTFRWVTPQTR
jgi:alkylated DNA repair dioxygenase AlkB